jgi:hypothetical protein
VRANAQRVCIMVLHRATQQPSGSHVSHAQKPVGERMLESDHWWSGFDVRALFGSTWLLSSRPSARHKGQI